MKSFLSLALFAGVSLAQNAQIGLPLAGQKLEKGSEVIVQIQRPVSPLFHDSIFSNHLTNSQNSLTSSTEMGVSIGIDSCGSRPCYPANEVMGTILYNGKFHPVYHEHNLPPYQNFTVKIPPGLASGRAHINVAHATLIGVSLDDSMFMDIC